MSKRRRVIWTRLMSVAIAMAAAVLSVCGAGTAQADTTASAACIAPAPGPRPAPIVHRPAALSTTHPAPLVIGLHAAGGTPRSFETNSGLDQVADQKGFVVAYLGSSTPATAWSPHSNDLPYISSVITQLTTPGNPCGPIDPQRVFVTGFSLGAAGTFQVGCQLSSQVAAIAPVSSALPVSAPCTLTHPVSELTIVGSNDRVPYLPTPGAPYSTVTTTNRWRALDGCMGEAQAFTTIVRNLTWNNCHGAAVSLTVIPGGTHQWPGAPNATGADARYNAAQAIWNFFAAHG